MYENGNTKNKNLMAILAVIDAEGEATASVLVEQTGLSVATISRALSILKTNKIISQLRKNTTEIGRKPDVFSINANYGFSLYFCMESGVLRGYLLDLTGRVAAQGQLEADAETTVPMFLEKLVQLRDQLLEKKKRAAGRILAVKLAIPGLTDVTSGVISRIPNYPFFENVNLASLVQETLGIRSFVHNTARLAAIGEYLLADEVHKNLVYLDITDDCGIGAGIILGGKLYEDQKCLAGEVGDMIINLSSDNWPELKTQGALERKAGLGAVLREAEKLVAGGHAPELSALMEKQKQETVSITLLEKAAMALDIDIYDLLNQTTKAWAAAIVNICALLAPDAVIIGGAIHSGNKLIEKMVRHHIGHMYYRPVNVQFSKKDASAHVLGAAYLSRKYLLDVVLEDLQEI